MASEITPDMVGEMVMLNGLNYTNAEIADELGVSESSVSKYTNQAEEQAKNSDDPFAVAWEHIMATQFDADFRAELAAGLSK